MINSRIIFYILQKIFQTFKHDIQVFLPMALVLILSSCLSFNNSDSVVGEAAPNQKSNNSPAEILLETKIDKGMINISGKTFSLHNTVLFSLKGSYPKDKLSQTQIVILSENQSIITSLPANLALNPVVLNVKNNKSLFIKEVYNNSSTITRVSTDADTLNYGLKL